MNWLSILIAAVISCTVFFGSLIVLHFLWVRPHKVGIPESTEDATYSPRKDIGRERGMFWAESIIQALKAYIPLLKKLDSRYWVSNIGLDGYSYILYQRQMLRMLFVFVGVYAIFNIPLTLWYRKLALPESPFAFDMQTHDQRMKFHQELRTIVDCLLVYFFSLGTFYTLDQIKKHIAYIIHHQKNSRTESEEIQKMKDRSVHVTGVFPEDRRGELLYDEINAFLDASNGGRIVSMIVVHDFVRVVELENERKNLESAHKVYRAQDSVMRRICFPWKYRQESAYQRKIQSIDDKIESEIMKPLLCSGHAFLCFDNVQSRDLCLKYYSPGAKQTLSAFWSAVSRKDPITPARRPTLRRKVTSTFQKFDDDNIIEKLRDNGLNILMKPLESPIDIFWANMGGQRGLFFLRRLVIFLVSIFVLLFLSTPASLLSALKQVQFLDVTHYIPDDSGIGTFVKQNLPPILILCLNQLLLFLIDYAAYMEKHDTHTGCQVSIFYKALFYLTFNMLIIPSLTLATAGDSLFTVLTQEGKSVAEILKQFYFSSPGSFFVNILLQNGAFSSSFHMLRLSEFFQAYGDTFLAYHQRNIINDFEKWRKQEMDVFQYGYFYGTMVSAFAIIIAYSVSNPWIMVAGMSFFLMRHLVDGFNLLTVFKMETDSEGKMIGPILTYTGLAVLLLQLALAISFKATGYNISFVLIVLLFGVSVFMIWRISRPIIVTEPQQTTNPKNTIRLQLLDVEAPGKVEQEQLKVWESFYKHPLLVSPAEFGNKSRSVSAVSLGSNNPQNQSQSHTEPKQ